MWESNQQDFELEAKKMIISLQSDKMKDKKVKFDKILRNLI